MVRADRQPETGAGAGVGYHELKASLRALELPAKLLGKKQFFCGKVLGNIEVSRAVES